MYEKEVRAEDTWKNKSAKICVQLPGGRSVEDFPTIYNEVFFSNSRGSAAVGLIKPPGESKPLVKEESAKKKARRIEKSPNVMRRIAPSPTK